MKCDDCAGFDAKLRATNPQPSKEMKAKIREERKKHLDIILGERKAWHARILECADSLDEEVMAIYIDGMDQDKTWIPHVPHKEQDKMSEKVLKVR